jgi:cytochrome bd ubiquinol oxidase subunit II
VAELWFALLCFTVTMFAVLDGWNFGAGSLHRSVARTDPERRQVIAALGPMWSWHEVWLIATGATFLLAFPSIMAASFSGFYLALWMVLWSFILRGISIEVGGHLDDMLWRTAWDSVFQMSSLLLALLFGTALGNVIRGVPLDATRAFSMALFTDFTPRGNVGIFDWYTMSTSVFTCVLLMAHGAIYLTMNADGIVGARSAAWARGLWIAALVLFPIVSLQTSVVRPEFHHGLIRRPLAWAAALVLIAGGWAVWTGLRANLPWRAFLGSCAVIASLLAGAAASLFPVILHSTLAPEHSMTVYNGAAPRQALAIALIWWPVAAVLALTYAAIVVRSHGTHGKS